ncbi:MAG: uroporphyrinogen-III C-methyltransferase [Deltaproteobacteria bacterium]|nr:uroporphyrinogen-III C-methyltransferase [Deltaproteobacteria bacterium]
MRAGFVYIVGAGPGSPALATIRAKEVLAEADVVLYDNLIHPDLLGWAPASAEKVWMGKVGHAHQLPQAEITAALVERAREGKVVVRLKGGDPTIFGRLGEEATALAEAGIPFEIVPGVTAASGAAAYAGIPLTHRDFAPSVTFVTGHRRKDGEAGPEIEWEALGRASGTLVLYMGIKHLKEVAAELIAAGRSPETPVALVRRATWADQQVVQGTLADIAVKVEASKIGPPAVAIVGEVTRLRATLAWLEKRPLWGRRILVTRAAGQAGDLSRLLRARGAEPKELPLIELRPYGHRSGTDATLRKLFAYDWVIFSSANAVAFTFGRLEELGLDARAFGAARVCAVGPKTAEALAGRGIRPDVVPEEYVAEGLIEALTRTAPLQGSRVLIPRAREAREVIPEELERLGARVEVLAVYENLRPESYPEDVLEELRVGTVAAVTLASSSAARNYAALCGERGIDAARTPCAVIGPATKKTAEALGLPVAVMPGEYTIEGLVEALEEHFRGSDQEQR